MAESKMKEVAKLLGVELNKPFMINNLKHNGLYVLKEDGMFNSVASWIKYSIEELGLFEKE